MKYFWQSLRLNKALEKHPNLKRNVVFERFVFNKRVQDIHESFDIFFTDLKSLVKSCEFGVQIASVVWDRKVLAITETRLQEKLLREGGDLSLAIVSEIFKAAQLERNKPKLRKLKM